MTRSNPFGSAPRRGVTLVLALLRSISYATLTPCCRCSSMEVRNETLRTLGLSGGIGWLGCAVTFLKKVEIMQDFYTRADDSTGKIWIVHL